MTAALDAPLFCSADRALIWAFRVTGHDVLSQASLYRWRGAERSPAELSPHERHAQAALIVLALESLDVLPRGYLRVKFLMPYVTWHKHPETGRREPDALPGSQDEWQALRRWVIAGFPTGVHGTREVQSLILRYMGAPIGYHRMRKDLCCKLDHVEGYRRIAYDRLHKLRSVAMDEFTNRLVQDGVISPSLPE